MGRSDALIGNKFYLRNDFLFKVYFVLLLVEVLLVHCIGKFISTLKFTVIIAMLLNGIVSQVNVHVVKSRQTKWF